MAPKYRVSYFPIKALGEPIRLLLSYGKMEFEDRRISSEEWPKYKESMPLGQMPTLEIDGKVLHQSAAIARYLGRTLKLAGDSDWEAMEVDIAVDTLNDLRSKVSATHYEPDEAIKEKAFAALKDTLIPFYLKKLEAMAAENKGHMALGKLTWADFWFLGTVDYISMVCRHDITEKNPNLKAVKENILALPAIKAWYEKSPKCDF